jgi:hypothetical protein
LEGESVVLIAIEEFHEAEALRFTAAEVSVVLKVVKEFVGGDVTVGVTIHTLESRVGGEISDWAKALTGGFESALTITDGDKKVLESVFWFVSEHC